jgi:hypothetical protein
MHERMSPHARPTESAAIMRQAFITGPEMNTLVFLKNWITMHIARSAALIVICEAVDFAGL